MGYSDTSKIYHLYDELNKKCIISRYVIFLESSKTDNVVDAGASGTLNQTRNPKQSKEDVDHRCKTKDKFWFILASLMDLIKSYLPCMCVVE